ncbi:MAG: hypothetical protein JWN93_3785 [Hyphomicrobiales bacterium]|nr:hypothetical protein [Hyphomicrobiales bacterium]
MPIYVISTCVDSGASYVLIRDDENREVSRVEALSREHARKLVSDCALLVAMRANMGVVIDW